MIRQEDLKATKYLTSETAYDRLPRAHTEVVFLGHSNVGKSALICALCDNNKLARVSKMPGRTQAINVFEVKFGRWLVDMPGYGFAMAEQKLRDYWPKMIGKYLAGRETLRLVMLLIDSLQGPGDIDLATLDWLRVNEVPFGVIVTKIDRVKELQRDAQRKNLAKALGMNPTELFLVSSKEGLGIKAVRVRVAEALN